MKKNLIILSLILVGFGSRALGQTLVYSQSFTEASPPTAAECSAWATFCSSLLSTYTYTGFKISGSEDPTGISCTVPSIAVAVANAMRTGTAGSWVDATDGQTWYVGIGCIATVGCPGTAVELSNQGTCSCAAGYSVRPMINNENWGGINGNTCWPQPTQTMTVTFFAGPPPPTFVGDSDVCDGSTITITASTTASGPAYFWSGPSSFSATTATISLPASPATAGVYTCYITSGGDTSIPSMDTIEVSPLPTITLGPNPVICQGTTVAHLTYIDTTGSPDTYSITYSAAALAAGFVNVTGAALPLSPISIPVPAAISGVFTGTLTVSHWVCESAGSYPFTVTVNPLPAAISGYIPVLCAGTPVTFTDGTGSGTWSSSRTTIAAAGLTTGSITGITTGTSIITYTLPTGCYITTPPVTVLIAPVDIVGPASICMGYPATYTEAATAGFWSSSNTSSATVGSLTGLVTPVAPGPTVISYSNGCGAGAFLPITVNPLPSVITGPANACVGLTTTLMDSTAGGTWSSLNTSIATVDSTTGVVTGAAGGTATIVYTLPTGCYITTPVTVTPPVAPIGGPSYVCTGFTSTMTESVTGGLWSISDPSLATIDSTSGIVTGVSLGIVHVTYTIGSGCSALKTVSVDPIAPIAGRDSVCVDGIGYITDIVGGGVWTSQFPAVATISVDSGLIHGISAGVSRMTYTLPTGCTETASVRVVALPPAITGTMKVCPGNTTSLSDAVSGGTWGSVNNLIATVNSSGVVSGVGADTVSIYYSILPGCVTSAVVLVNPLPAPISGDDVVCPGIKDTLTDASAGGIWSSLTPSLATVNATTGVVTTISGGTATIKYTLPLTGCSITTNLSIYPLPAPTITYTLEDETLYATAGYVTYQWYDSIQGKIPGATSPSLAGLNTEYYYVVVTDSNGCTGISALYEFNASGLGIKNTQSQNIRIYPNPTDGVIYIESPMNVRAIISSVDGKKELEQTNAHTLDMSRLASGVYFIALYNDSGAIITVQKITKQ